MRSAIRCCGVGLLGFTLAACAPKPIPDPKVAARKWLEAVQTHDAGAAYALLDEASRRDRSPEEVAELLRTHERELAAIAAAAVSARARLNVDVRVDYGRERAARVVIEDGRYRVASLGALPARASDPVDALRELRAVLARRSFAGLIRVLTRDSGRTLEHGLDELVNALDEAATIEIDVQGRRAIARLPDGHHVTLEREDGVWKVKDFE